MYNASKRIYKKKLISYFLFVLFFMKDEELLEKHNKIWGKVNNSIKERI